MPRPQNPPHTSSLTAPWRIIPLRDRADPAHRRLRRLWPAYSRPIGAIQPEVCIVIGVRMRKEAHIAPTRRLVAGARDRLVRRPPARSPQRGRSSRVGLHARRASVTRPAIRASGLACPLIAPAPALGGRFRCTKRPNASNAAVAPMTPHCTPSARGPRARLTAATSASTTRATRHHHERKESASPRGRSHCARGSPPPRRWSGSDLQRHHRGGPRDASLTQCTTISAPGRAFPSHAAAMSRPLRRPRRALPYPGDPTAPRTASPPQPRARGPV